MLIFAFYPGSIKTEILEKSTIFVKNFGKFSVYLLSTLDFFKRPFGGFWNLLVSSRTKMRMKLRSFQQQKISSLKVEKRFSQPCSNQFLVALWYKEQNLILTFIFNTDEHVL